jgi:hypothetical protein
MSWSKRLTGMVGVGAAAYVGLVTGAVPVDLGVGRQVRTLGPRRVDIAAPRELVFDLLTQPYLDPRPPRALRDKVQVLERGTDMVLALHRTPLRGGLVARTVETVRFTRPERIDFRLVRGPVPHVVEQFVLTATDFGTRLEYHGELGTDLWAAGRWWGQLVARQWEAVVAASFAAVKAEAERRTARRAAPDVGSA